MRSSAARCLLVVCVPLVAMGGLAVAQSPCGPAGLTLTWGETTRLGDAFSIDLAGAPGVSGLLGADVTQGPVPTSVGLVCLGLSPSLITLPFTLSPLGSFSLGGIVPSDPSFNGVSAYLQAAAIDPSQPNGFALSNGLHPVLRPPRLWIHTGAALPPSMCVYDASTETPGPTLPLPGTFVNNAAVPVSALGWLAALVNSVPGAPPHLMAFDANGVTTLDVTFPAFVPNPPFSGNAAALCLDGTTAYVLFVSPTGGASIGSYALPSGAPVSAVPLPYPVSGSMVPNPGTGVVFIASGLSVVPVDLANAYALPPISLGATASSSNGIAELAISNGRLYSLLAGTGIFGAQTPSSVNAIDLSTFTPVLPSPRLFPGLGSSFMQFVTDSAGPAVVVNQQGNLLRFDAASLQMTLAATVVPGNMVLAPGGTALLISGNGNQRVDLPTYATSPFFVPPVGVPYSTTFLPLPSTTLRKAYMATSINATNPLNQIVWFGTEPVTSLGVQPLPLSALNLKVIVD